MTIQNTQELVSIIMPAYNNSLFIAGSIESVLSQTYTNWELLITDDCSKDDTWDIIQRYAAADTRIKPYQMKFNSGPTRTRNESIRRATGRYIAFLDSDDRWTPDKLEKHIAFMKEKNCALSYTSYYVCNRNQEVLRTIKGKPEVTFDDMINYNHIGCLTAMYDTQKLGVIMMPHIQKRQDWALWLLILKHTGKAYGLQEPLAYYTQNGKGSISSNKLKLVKYNFSIYWIVLNFSFLKSFRLFAFKFMPLYLKMWWNRTRRTIC